MSEAYLLGVLEQLQEAEMTFDRYHVKAQLNAAVDEVREAERLEHGGTLKRSRYLWLKRPANLNEKQRGRLDGFLRLSLKTGRAYNWHCASNTSTNLTANKPARICGAGSLALSARACNP